MEKQQDDNNTTAVMKDYNFDKQINVSIIYEDHDEVPTCSNSHQGGISLINKLAELLASMNETFANYCGVIAVCKDRERKQQLDAQLLYIKNMLFIECKAVSREFVSRHEVTDQYINSILLNIEQVSKKPTPYDEISKIHDSLLKWIATKQFEMSLNLSDESQSYRPIARTIHQHFSPENDITNMPAANISPSRPPESDTALGNIVDSTIHAAFNTQDDNINWMRRAPNSNHSFNGANDQQPTNFDEPTDHHGAIDVHNSASILNVPERVDNDTQIGQRNADDTTRNSISRDSGIISPLMSVSPLQCHYDTVQWSSLQQEQRISNPSLPVMIPTETIIIIDD